MDDVQFAHPWTRDQPITQQEALIVAGAYRCGTTSLYAFLAGHPDINPSTIKEPAFFFSLRMRQQAYPAGHETASYLSLFPRRSARVLLEATSNYFNDPGCAARIRRALPAARVIVTLRDPIARLVSWYKFLVLQGQMPEGLSFVAWVRRQLDDATPNDARPYAFQALGHGRYSSYLAEYFRELGRERVLLVWFDDLTRDPHAVMRRVCAFAQLAPGYYDGYGFPRQNEAMRIRRPRLFRAYRGLHRRAFGALRRTWPRPMFRFETWFFGVFEPRILPFFTGPAEPVEVPAALRAELVEYYRDDVAPLRDVSGEDVPWAAAYGD